MGMIQRLHYPLYIGDYHGIIIVHSGNLLLYQAVFYGVEPHLLHDAGMTLPHLASFDHGRYWASSRNRD